MSVQRHFWIELQTDRYLEYCWGFEIATQLSTPWATLIHFVPFPVIPDSLVDVGKEAFEVMAKVEPLHWFTATTHCFDLYTGHKTLVFTFDPLSIFQDITQFCIRKVLCCAHPFYTYKYTCFRMRRDLNIPTDFLSHKSFLCTINQLITVPSNLPASSVNIALSY